MLAVYLMSGSMIKCGGGRYLPSVSANGMAAALLTYCIVVADRGGSQGSRCNNSLRKRALSGLSVVIDTVHIDLAVARYCVSHTHTTCAYNPLCFTDSFECSPLLTQVCVKNFSKQQSVAVIILVVISY